MASLAICIVIRICSKDSSKILQDHGTLAKVTIVKDGTFLLVLKRRIFILICAKKSCVLCSLKLFKGFMWNLCRMMEYCLSKSGNTLKSAYSSQNASILTLAWVQKTLCFFLSVNLLEELESDGVSEIRYGGDLWQWSGSRSEILQQFIRNLAHA